MPKRKEKYYICPECGELVTETIILDECSQGSCGMCYCQFGAKVWYKDCFDYETYRVLIPYVNISINLYKELLKEPNNVLRLRMFKQVPNKWRLKY